MDGWTLVVVGDLRVNALLHAAQDRKMFVNMVANVRLQQGTPNRRRLNRKEGSLIHIKNYSPGRVQIVQSQDIDFCADVAKLSIKCEKINDKTKSH